MPVRPFEHILGQRAAVDVLANAIDTGRIHHAWIFHGPEGVGKRTAAMAFATALLNPSARVDDAGVLIDEPGETQALIESGSHPDLHVVTKELARHSEHAEIRNRKLTTIPVEVLRERVLGPAWLAPTHNAHGSASKVFIIDEAELMAAPAQNALLKTLEEPPGGTVIILVSAAAERLLPTIRSRCQRVAFGPLSQEEMDRWFRGWGGAEGVANDPAALEWIREGAGGSPGRAVLAIQSGLARWPETLGAMLEATERGQFQSQLGSTMAKLIDDWAKEWVNANEGASKDAANKAGARHMFALLNERGRHRLRACVSADRLDASDAPLRWLEQVRKSESHIANNVNMTLAFENLATQLAQP